MGGVGAQVLALEALDQAVEQPQDYLTGFTRSVVRVASPLIQTGGRGQAEDIVAFPFLAVYNQSVVEVAHSGLAKGIASCDFQVHDCQSITNNQLSVATLCGEPMSNGKK